jgi:hypothetical protein
MLVDPGALATVWALIEMLSNALSAAGRATGPLVGIGIGVPAALMLATVVLFRMKRDRFAWEYKRKDKYKTLDEAYRQLYQYRDALQPAAGRRLRHRFNSSDVHALLPTTACGYDAAR